MTRRFLLLLLFAWLAGAARAGEAPLIDFTEADFVVADSATPPPDSAPWQTVTLPDQWRLTRPGVAGNGWYRLRFRIDRPDPGLQAVYLPKLVMNAAVFLNGEAIGDGGSFSEPIARNWNRPLFFPVPGELLRPGDNVLHVRLLGHPYTQAALHPLQLGPENQLRPIYERAYFLNITLNQTAGLLIAAVGVLTLNLWLRRRQETAYGYFGLSALVWSLQATNLYLSQAPVDTAHWEILTNAGFQIFSGFLLISLLRFVGLRQPALVGTLWFGIFAAPLSLWLAPAAWYLPLTAGWHFYTLLAALSTLALLLRAAWRERNRDARFLVGAMGLVVLFGLHDWLIHSQHIWHGRTAWPLTDVFLLHYSAPLVFLALGLIMTGRYVSALNEYEALADELDHRVQDKHLQLQESYARMRELETERAVTEERERIFRDLHDDVGAKLLSLVYRAQRAEDADLARSALRDLRDVVSYTGAARFTLDELAADWRSECEQRLSEAGIRLDWQNDGAAEALSQPQALNIGRILREAISNVIRHAGASSVAIRLEATEDALHLSIVDDGRGLAEDAQPRGRGLRNMQVRAQRLGGEVAQVNGDGGGCRIALRVPLTAPVA